MISPAAPSGAGTTDQDSMYPCSVRMRASSTLSLDAGTSTVACAAWIALRTRVRKSAMGSAIDMPWLSRLFQLNEFLSWGSEVWWGGGGGARGSKPVSARPLRLCSTGLLPGGLRHPRDLAVVGELAKADAAHAELPVDRARPATPVASSICTCLELGGPRLLDAQRCLGHQSVLSFSAVYASLDSGEPSCPAAFASSLASAAISSATASATISSAISSATSSSAISSTISSAAASATISSTISSATASATISSATASATTSSAGGSSAT